MTGDETWVYQYDPETKQSKQWLPRGLSGPIKFESERSVKKVVVVWKGIHSRSDTNRTGAEGLSFYYPRLLHCLNQIRSESDVKKVMATVFWDSEGVVLVDFSVGKKTVTGTYYIKVLRKLRAK